MINLSLTLDTPTQLYHGETRAGYRHNMTVSRGGRDDTLDNFAMQGSSQWDGLRHVRYREFGYWGGLQDEDVDGRGLLGIEHWAAARHHRPRRADRRSAPLRGGRRAAVSPPSRRRSTRRISKPARRNRASSLQHGDILLLRTGWLRWFRSLNDEEKEALRGRLNPGEDGLDMPGLDPSTATAAWLWNRRIAAVAADNPALEALRVDAEVGFQHRRLIALQGMAIGELWDLEALAEDCAADGVYEFMLVSAPLNVPGAVGSPANAYAIK